MRTSLIIAALIAVGGTAVANPSTRSSDPSNPADPADSVSVTVTSGRGRLGFAALQISPALRAHFGAPNDRGVLVDNVQADSPAAKAGLRPGDVVLSVDGEKAESAFGILDAISDRKKGDAVAIEIVRHGQKQKLEATLDDEPGPSLRQFSQFGGTHFGPSPFDRDPWFGRGMFDDDMRKMMDEMKKRIEQLEKQQRPRPALPRGKRT